MSETVDSVIQKFAKKDVSVEVRQRRPRRIIEDKVVNINSKETNEKGYSEAVDAALSAAEEV